LDIVTGSRKNVM